MLLSREHGDLSIFSGRHNTNTVSLHIEMFLAVCFYNTFQHVVTRLERRIRIAARNVQLVRRALVERVLCDRVLHNYHALWQNRTCCLKTSGLVTKTLYDKFRIL